FGEDERRGTAAAAYRGFFGARRKWHGRVGKTLTASGVPFGSALTCPLVTTRSRLRASRAASRPENGVTAQNLLGPGRSLAGVLEMTTARRVPRLRRRRWCVRCRAVPRARREQPFPDRALENLDAPRTIGVDRLSRRARRLRGHAGGAPRDW